MLCNTRMAHITGWGVSNFPSKSIYFEGVRLNVISLARGVGWYQNWVQLHKITSITITVTLKYRLKLQLHHHNVILNYNYTMFITITVQFLRKLYFFMMEYWVNRFWVVFQFCPEHCLVTLPPLSLPTLFGSIISRNLISCMCGTSELDHTLKDKSCIFLNILLL